MYKVQMLITKGMQVEKLPADIQDDINTLKIITDDFATDDADGHEYDEAIYDVILTNHSDLIPADGSEGGQSAQAQEPEAEKSPVPAPENILIGDKYFEQHPEKILGKQTIGGKYGNAIVVTGDKKTLEIDVPAIPKVFVKFNKETSVSKESKEDIVAEVEKAVISRRVQIKSKKRTVKKEISPDQSTAPEFYTFREICKIYNGDISRQELEAYLYSNPILPWEKYIDEFEFQKDQLVKEGYLFYENSKLIYKWIYLSGDINKKITYVKRDENIIREQFGNEVYENQINSLRKNMPQQATINIDTEAAYRINLSPISEFAKTFMVSDEEMAFTDKVGNAHDLNYWFVEYLRHMQREEPESFKGSEFKHVRQYVQGESIIVMKSSGDATAEEKKIAEKANKNARQKAKEVAESLFNRFLFEELYSEAKMRIEIIWNEKYNSYRLPDLNKIPVGFTMSKFIKDAHLKLNPTQRESASFISYNRAGCLALEVGLGKTIGALISISQAVENGLASYPMIVSPKNVYWQWQHEIEGYYDDKKKKNMVGVLHHFPKVLMLGNCNEKSVIHAKDYSDEEMRDINAAFADIELANEQIRIINKYKTINQQLFVKADNPLSDIARMANDYADKYVKLRQSKIIKKYENQIERSKFNEPVYKKLIKQLEELLAKEAEKITDTFARYYRKLVKEKYSYLVYMTGKFKNYDKGTITIVTEEALKNNKIGVRDSDAIVERMYNILSGGDVVRQPNDTGAQSEYEKEYYQGETEKEPEMTMVEQTQLYEKIKARVEARLGNAKVALEDLKIDLIVIDEAHHSKKVFPSLIGQVKKGDDGKPKDEIKTTKSGDKLKVEREALDYSLGSGETSGTAMSAFILSTYIQSNTKTGNMILLTATPFENDPLEIYSMLCLSNYEKLVEMGYENMKEFFDTYMKIDYDFKIKINGVEKATILTGFQNLIQFRNVVRAIILHRTGEQANIDRPEKIIIPYLNRGLLPESIKEIRAMLMPTSEQRDLIKKIEMFIEGAVTLTDLQLENTEKYMIEQTIREQEALESQSEKEAIGDEDAGETIDYDERQIDVRKPKDVVDVTLQTESEQKGTRIIQAFSLIRQITLSPWALKLTKDANILPTAEQLIESSPKLQFIMACVKSVKEYHEKQGTEISGQIIYSVVGKDFFPLIKDYLIKNIGFKKEQVGIIHGGISDKNKEDLKKAFNDGIVKVLIASKSIQVGANLNTNATVMYHLFYDWNPTDNEQINGRIWRQGNRYGAVRIVYPMVENSVDPVVFQYLGEKTMRIKDVWDVSGVKSQLDLSEFDPNKMKLAALTDPYKKAKFQIEIEKENIRDEIIYLQNKLDKVNEIPGIIKSFHYYMKESVMKIEAFFIALKNYRLSELAQKRDEDIEVLTDQKNEVFKPIQELIDKRDDEISLLTNNINDQNEKLTAIDDEVKSIQTEIKSKISDAVIDGDDELVKKLQREYKDAEKNLKTAKEKEIKAKIAEFEKSIKSIQTKYQAKIDPLQKKLEEKLQSIIDKIEKTEAEYNKNVQATADEFNEKINKAINRSDDISFKEYLTYLSYQSTYIIKWCRDSDAEGRFSRELSIIRDNRSYYIGDLEQYKNYKGQYEKIKLSYLDPMGIAEEDAENLPVAIRKELADKQEQLEKIGDKFAALVEQYTQEYNERLFNAKTPEQESEGFAMLNFLLDEVEDVEAEDLKPAEEEKPAVPGKKKIVPKKKQTEGVDIEYLKDKIEIFEMALEGADDEMAMYLETKIEIFKEALSMVESPEADAVPMYARGGIIYQYRLIDELTGIDEIMSQKEVIQYCNKRNDPDKTDVLEITNLKDAVWYCEHEGIILLKTDATKNYFARGGRIEATPSLSSFIDLVTEDLMTPGEFVKYMQKKGKYILPDDVFLQIERINSYNTMLKIFETNELI